MFVIIAFPFLQVWKFTWTCFWAFDLVRIWYFKSKQMKSSFCKYESSHGLVFGHSIQCVYGTSNQIKWNHLFAGFFNHRLDPVPLTWLSPNLPDVSSLVDALKTNLFSSILCNSNHVLYQLIPPEKTTGYNLAVPLIDNNMLKKEFPA